MEDYWIDDYMVICDEDLQKVVDKVNLLCKNYNYKPQGNLFVVRTNYQLNITLSASGSISWCGESPGGSYSWSNVWVGNPTWKNIYHQVMVHYKDTSMWRGNYHTVSDPDDPTKVLNGYSQ